MFDSENMTSNYELFEDTPTNYNDVRRQDAVYHPNFVPDLCEIIRGSHVKTHQGVLNFALNSAIATHFHALSMSI